MPRSDLCDSRTWVYQCYCEHGLMLYVGIAVDLERRLNQHRSTKDWWPEVAWVQSDQYATRFQALRVEAYWITYYRPKYNVAGQPAEPALPHRLLRRRDFVTEHGALAVTLNDSRDHAGGG